MQHAVNATDAGLLFTTTLQGRADGDLESTFVRIFSVLAVSCVPQIETGKADIARYYPEIVHIHLSQWPLGESGAVMCVANWQFHFLNRQGLNEQKHSGHQA